MLEIGQASAEARYTSYPLILHVSMSKTAPTPDASIFRALDLMAIQLHHRELARQFVLSSWLLCPLPMSTTAAISRSPYILY